MVTDSLFIHRHLHPKSPTVLGLGWVRLAQPNKSIKIQQSNPNPTIGFLDLHGFVGLDLGWILDL
jgi:hypothetical protein